tara:strand:+ start:1700 stop:1996 length:297 start_codon:yes stop_codon:yes gene_type:complete
MIYKRYQFNDKAQAEQKVSAFIEVNEQGDKVQTIKASFIWLDKFVKVNGKYNEKGEEITAPIFTDPYSLDVVWDDLEESPYGWKSYEIDPKNPKHTIL